MPRWHTSPVPLTKRHFTMSCSLMTIRFVKNSVAARRDFNPLLFGARRDLNQGWDFRKCPPCKSVLQTRNCKGMSLQLQWAREYVGSSVALTGVQIAWRAQLRETKRTPLNHVFHSARLMDSGFKPGYAQDLFCTR